MSPLCVRYLVCLRAINNEDDKEVCVNRVITRTPSRDFIKMSEIENAGASHLLTSGKLYLYIALMIKSCLITPSMAFVL